MWRNVSRIRIFLSRIKTIPDPGSASASKNWSISNPKNYFLALVIRSGMHIPDPDPEFGSWFITHPDPGSRGQKGAGSTTLISSILLSQTPESLIFRFLQVLFDKKIQFFYLRHVILKAHAIGRLMRKKQNWTWQELTDTRGSSRHINYILA